MIPGVAACPVPDLPLMTLGTEMSDQYSPMRKPATTGPMRASMAGVEGC